MSNDRDYAEELLQSIDTVISARLNNISYDRTIVCTITDASKRDYGQYTVTDGSTTFEAYSDNTTYMTNQQVQVTVPNGDWSAQKVIVGRYVTNDNPIIYRSPTSGITNATGDLVEENETCLIASGEAGDVFKFGDKLESKIKWDKDKLKYLCIKAEFRSLLNQYRFTSGNYGIKVVINGNIEFNLDSSKDMFGSVYNFVEYVPQEQAFAIPTDVENIKSFEVYFYQDGKFEYYNEDNDIVPLQTKDQCELWVRNLQVYLGGPVAEGLGPEIFTTEDIYYYPGSETDDCKRTVNLIWNELDENNQSVNLDSNAIINWYADTKEGSLKQLRTKTTHETSIEIDCVKELTYTSVQATVERIENTTDKVAIYKSNILKFENYINKTTTIPKTDLQIEIRNIGKYTKDSYTCYDQAYNIITEKDVDSEGKEVDIDEHTPRIVGVMWRSQSGVIDSSFFKSETDIITWEDLPTKVEADEKFTMLSSYEDNVDEKDFKIDEEGWNLLYPVKAYTISNKYRVEKDNNIIKCVVTIPTTGGDIIYNLEKKIEFSYKAINDGKKEVPAFEIIDEKIESIYSYIKDPKIYFNQEKVFQSLTNGGQAQGLFKEQKKDKSGNPVVDNNGQPVYDIYLNASYISTGILRSNNWAGTLYNETTKTTFESWDDALAAIENPEEDESYSDNWSISATKGTYWNLNDGQLFAKNFELNAWDNDSGGLYLNSDTSAEMQFSVGGKSDFIQFGKEKGLVIQTNNTFTLNAWNNNKGVYISSEPDENGLYFAIGNSTSSYIKYTNDGKLIIRGTLQFTDGTNPVDQDAIQDLNDAFDELNAAFDDLEVPTDTEITNLINNNSKVQAAYNTANSVVSDYLINGNGTTIDKSYVISPYIGGGYLHIAKGNNSVTIDPAGYNENVIFDVKKNGNTVIGFDSNGNATFSGQVKASSLETTGGGNLGGWTFDNNLFYKQSGGHAIAFAFNDVGQDSRCFAIGNFNPTDTSWGTDVGFSITGLGKLAATGAVINGVLTCSTGSKVGPVQVDGNSIFIGSWTSKSLSDAKQNKPPRVFMCSDTDYSYTIAGHTANNWTFGSNTTFGVTADGTVYCSKGVIGGWKISPNYNGQFIAVEAGKEQFKLDYYGVYLPVEYNTDKSTVKTWKGVSWDTIIKKCTS